MISYELSDLIQRLHNLIRIGTVTEANYSKRRLKILIGEITTGWLPWLTQKSFGNIKWNPPEVGEQVAVVSPSGDLRKGLVMPSIYQSSQAPNDASADLESTTYKDGAKISYDRSLHNYTISIPNNGATVNILSGGTINLNATKINVNGDLSVAGSVNATGDILAGGSNSNHHSH